MRKTKAAPIHPERRPASRKELFTFGGVLIILATFVVREGYQARAKDTIDSVRSAENVLLVRADEAVASARLASLELDVLRIQSQISAASSDLVKLGIIENELRAEASFLATAKDALDDMSHLLDKIPGEEANKNEIIKFQQAITETQEQCDRTLQDTGKLKGRAAEGSLDKATLTSLIAQWTDFSAADTQSQAELVDSVARISTDVMHETESVVERNERRYERSELIGGLFFLAGIGFTAWGKLSGVGEPIAGE